MLHEERFVDLAPQRSTPHSSTRGATWRRSRTMYGLHRRQAACPSGDDKQTHPAHAEARAVRQGAERVVVLGRVEAARPRPLGMVLPVLDLDVYSRYAVGWCISEHETAKV
ncbi:MAG: hypothetical protein U5R31_15395 [Acidimicrobiia bacterium]|nr:hypothetical protein [Acidimicrobiia bacterium]